MLGSKNNFFFQSPEILKHKGFDVDDLLRLKGYNSKQIAIYLEAYNYFKENPDRYDGATIVKDLIDIPGLDLDAMLHDYHYIVFNAAAHLGCKWKADWLYVKGMEKKGKGSYSCYSRFVGLTTFGSLFAIYARLKRGKMTQKDLLKSHYKLLLKTK